MSGHTNDDLATYLSAAIQRIDAGEAASPKGSHLAGIFSRAATAFEKETKSYLSRVMAECGINFETDVRPNLREQPTFEKLTLGQSIVALQETARQRSIVFSKQLPNGLSLKSLVGTLDGVNRAWVAVKHGRQPSEATLVAELRSMRAAVQAFQREAPGS